MAKPNALPFIVIPLTSVVFGIFLNVMMFHKGPGHQMPSLVKSSTKQLIKNLGVELDSSLASKVGLVAKSGLQHSIPTKLVQLLGSGEPSKILWLLISFFKVALERSLGQSIVLLILGITAPLLLKASLETIKPKKSSSALLGALTVLFFTSIGQIITIACATNFFYVPLYSLARYNQIKSADQQSIHASSFDSSSLILVLGLNSLAGVIFFFTTFVPIHNEYWVLTNIIFQFFPLVLIPLLFTPRARPMQTSRSNGFLTASSLFKQISYFAVLIHYLAIFLALPQVVEASKASKSYSILTIAKTMFGGLNDGEWLLLFDALGMLGASILILSLDHFAEEQQGEKRNKEVSPRLSLVLLLGPGFVLADFMARKQEAVEGKILKKE